MTSQETVLVTGGTGFVGSWVCLYALKAGYKVRTTVRSLQRADVVREMMVNGGATPQQAESIEFVAADLVSDKGWNEACAGVTYIHHVASPFPSGPPKHEDDLIIPAREGTMRVLNAAKAAGTVKRIVITSSIAAVAYGHPPNSGKTYTEADWSDLNGRTVPAYPKSKTVAERAAWEWGKNESAGIELATVNPGGIVGPVLGKSAGTSVDAVVRMLSGGLPLVPRVYINWVDVRDVADLHMKAMTAPQAKGERYIACNEGAWLKELAQYLKEGLGDKASKVSTREVPDFLVKFAALFDKSAALIKDEVGNVKHCSGEKARTQLGWQPKPVREAVVATGESVIKYGLV